MKYYDPYDIWSLPSLGDLKIKWTQGKKKSSVIVPLIGILEIIAPNHLRKYMSVKPNIFAHVEAMRYLSGDLTPRETLDVFTTTRVRDCAWGLPFSWFSKNGVYPANTPYITNTPYVMEALLDIACLPEFKVKADRLFEQTWDFLETLEVMHSTSSELALSYAPIREPRMVVNANSYAALAYALHAVYGNDEIRALATERAERLINWVLAQQQENGSWFYYADDAPGNFIDGFHSCFVIKNLLKTQKLLPNLEALTQPAINNGWLYVRNYLYDPQHNLCRRFSHRSHRDPFRWDLYDQAEYLGLLIDFELLDEAQNFASRVESRFQRNSEWFCRIDIFGRPWGKGFRRWGITPYLYQRYRLQHLNAGSN
ncbi:hypothetical protein E5198_00250 [Pseudomonas sp. A-1]|uniref:hypothetical protein n=1 Tax=Pseudomonas sp. A-1 TaxID=1821274 RepID=UPI0010A5C85E|nr:hypothetical protein [Pseudomonas sp. A-1]THG87295.1 hypothetical protein E5198_00250 [Pseudomonas sp. A-1]